MNPETPTLLPAKARIESDNLCKRLAESYPEQFVAWLFGARPGPVKIFQTELNREPLRADSAILLERDDEIFHIEFQTSARSHVPLPVRMLNYYASFKYLSPSSEIRQALIMLKETGQTIPAGYRSHCLEFRYTVIKLWEQDADALLQHDGLLPLAVLCQADDGPRLLQRVAEKITALPTQDERARQLARARLLAGLRYAQEMIYDILQGGSMIEESTVYQDIWQKGRGFGKQEGKQEGFSEGFAQGSERERQLVLRMLTRQLGSIPTGTQKRISQLTVEKIEELGEALLSFTDRKELTAWLRTHSRNPKHS